MKQPLPNTMQAAAIDRFGGIETIRMHNLPVPKPGPDEVLIRVEVAGVAVWDALEREGAFVEMTGKPQFPLVLGSEGAGTVAAVGENVEGFREGDRVYAAVFLNPKGGFYAEYAAVKAGAVSHIPSQLTVEQAGVMSGDATTAVRGLDDKLHLQPGESVMIFGASGGLGHLAVQLAKQMGARVFAVASGEHGVALVRRLGADAVVDGHTNDVAAAAREFAPGGIDAALFTAGGEAADQALAAVRDGGRIAFPNGVEPELKAPPGIDAERYDGMADAEIMGRLNRFIEKGPFAVHVARTFPLAQAAEAHRALDTRFLGKLALRLS